MGFAHGDRMAGSITDQGASTPTHIAAIQEIRSQLIWKLCTPALQAIVHHDPLTTSEILILLSKGTFADFFFFASRHCNFLALQDVPVADLCFVDPNSSHCYLSGLAHRVFLS